jgi:hypothetical protein
MELFERSRFHEIYDEHLTKCVLPTVNTLKVMTKITGHNLEDLQAMTHAVLDEACRLAVVHYHTV